MDGAGCSVIVAGRPHAPEAAARAGAPPMGRLTRPPAPPRAGAPSMPAGRIASSPAPAAEAALASLPWSVRTALPEHLTANERVLLAIVGDLGQAILGLPQRMLIVRPDFSAV